MQADDSRGSFYTLGPEQVLQAVEGLGLHCDGHQLALNSYENRVYQIGLVDAEPVVAKFYRPGRWPDAAILEEHAFTLELAALDIPVVAPLVIRGSSLHHVDGHRFSLYPRRVGQAPNLEERQHLQQLGRFVGRIHALGAAHAFEERPTLDVQHFGDESCLFLLDHGFIPADLETAYETLAQQLLDTVEQAFERVDAAQIRLHGDGHAGNVLWRDDAPIIVDFDDARMGPAVQDLWMFLSGGERGDMEASLDILLTAYTQFHDFDTRELMLIEPLRTLRMMHHAAWLARRWQDPAFKHAFPWFNTQSYWERHILSLKEQGGLLHEPPLQWSA